MSSYHESAPESLSGHLLLGTDAVRFIFLDEAGTSGSREEKTCIVAGVIVHADKQLLAAEALLKEALTSVPEEFRDGFAFHAEDIMNNDKYRERWRLTDRVNLLKEVMAIPRRLKIPFSFGQVWARAPAHYPNFKPHEGRHMQAFWYCICKADQYLRESAEPAEIATIVAENHQLAKQLRQIVDGMRKKPFIFKPEHLVDRQIDLEQGFNSQNGILKVTRIRRSIHFVGKTDDELVWIADALAYGLKRFFSELEFGEVFYKAIGAGINRSDFAGPSSGMLLRWEPP